MKIDRIKRIHAGKLTFSNRCLCNLPMNGMSDFPTKRFGFKDVGQEEIQHLIEDGYFENIKKKATVAGADLTKKNTKK